MIPRAKNRLMQLRQENHERHKALAGFNGKLHNATDDAVTIYLYDLIDQDSYWGFTAVQMLTLLAQADGRRVKLRINSPGGDVFEARAMATAIAQYQGGVDVMIDSLAASAATFVAAAGQSRTMAEGGMWMIHKAWTIAVGNEDDLADTVSMLQKADATILSDYRRITGQEDQQLVDWMAAETWFTGAEAKDAGFVDELWVPGQSANAAADGWSLGAYQNAPQPKAGIVVPELEPEKPSPVAAGIPGHLRAKAHLLTKQIA